MVSDPAGVRKPFPRALYLTAPLVILGAPAESPAFLRRLSCSPLPKPGRLLGFSDPIHRQVRYHEPAAALWGRDASLVPYERVLHLRLRSRGEPDHHLALCRSVQAGEVEEERRPLPLNHSG